MDNSEILGNVPPQDLEAEQAVLGSVLISGAASDTLAAAHEFVEPDDFYHKANQLIFKAMLTVDDNGDEIDMVTLQAELSGNNELDDIGGLDYLAELVDASPSAANVAYYAQLVRNSAIRRRLITVANGMIADAQRNDDVTGLLDNAEQAIMNVADERSGEGFRRVRDVISAELDHISKLSEDNEEITGLPTGYREFDLKTSGLQPDNLVILAARPAVGKTALALNIAQNVAVSDQSKTVAIFSLEMSAESLVSRMLCAEGTIKANNLRSGNLSADEWESLMMAASALSGASIYIDDTPGIKMSEIRAKSRRLAKEQGGLDLIVVDYLQLIEGSTKESRQQEVSEISRQLKKLAKELNVPIIALSQLSRGVEQRQDKRPVLSDIRESGSIEQDADIVTFLYREDYYERDNGDDEENQQQGQANDPNDSDAGEVELIIEKNRAGSRGTVRLMFMKAYNKFANLAYQDEP